MIGVSQASRILHIIDMIQSHGGRKISGGQNYTTYTNPFNTTGDGAPYIFITKKFDIRFGHTVTGSSIMSEEKVNALMQRWAERLPKAPEAENGQP